MRARGPFGPVAHLFCVLALISAPVAARAQDQGLAQNPQTQRSFTLTAAPELAESGLLGHLLPRFALKTGRRAVLSDPPAEATLAPDLADGTPAFARDGRVFRLHLSGGSAPAALFRDWLLSEAGQAAVTGFLPADGLPFTAAPVETQVQPPSFDGDAHLGKQLAEIHCSRCHSVAPGDRANIGSTASFMAMRALPDWDQRFLVFYALNPHPAFLRITDVSPPFDPARPPSLVPIELSLTEAEAIQAYAASLDPADLGAEIEAR